MEVKEMREAMKIAGETVPRSNADVISAYGLMQELGTPPVDEGPTTEEIAEAEAENDAFEKVIADAESEMLAVTNSKVIEIPAVVKPKFKAQTLDGEVYTYVGFGDTPPHMIKFMGLQNFIRGQATTVTRIDVLEKIKNHKCFVKGEVDPDVLFGNDKVAAAKAQFRRDEDMKLQIVMDRKNRKG